MPTHGCNANRNVRGTPAGRGGGHETTFQVGNLGDLAGDKEGGALFLLVRDLLSVQSVALCCWDGGRISLRIVCTCVALRSAMRVMTGG
jgi:hypothetical protein